MKLILFSLIFISQSFAISEVVYVESPTDTDNDGKKDLIYVKVKRPLSGTQIEFSLDHESFISMNLSSDLF